MHRLVLLTCRTSTTDVGVGTHSLLVSSCVLHDVDAAELSTLDEEVPVGGIPSAVQCCVGAPDESTSGVVAALSKHEMTQSTLSYPTQARRRARAQWACLSMRSWP